MDSLMFLVHLTLLALFSSSRCSAAKEFSLARFSTTSYANNSVINIRLVGEGFNGSQITNGGALECHTDDTTCCRGIDNPPNGVGRGEWYYPNGTVVPPPGGGLIYRTRDHMMLRLNRGPDISTLSSKGDYRCVIPGAGGVTITRYIALENGLRCSDLPDVTNGEVTYTPPRSVSGESLPDGDRYTGTITTYSCSLGYQLVGGSSLRACGPDGNWNGTEPSCEVGQPTSQTSVPGDSTFAPGDSTSVPGDSTSVPGDSTFAPGDSTSAPGDSTSVPGDSTSVPGDSTSVQGRGDSTTVPGDTSTSAPGGGVIGASVAAVVVILLTIVVVLICLMWRASRKKNMIDTSAVHIQKIDFQPEQKVQIGSGKAKYEMTAPIPEFKGGSSPPPDQQGPGIDELARLKGLYSVVNKKKAPPVPGYQGDDEMVRLESLYSVVQKEKPPPIPEFRPQGVEDH